MSFHYRSHVQGHESDHHFYHSLTHTVKQKGMLNADQKSAIWSNKSWIINGYNKLDILDRDSFIMTKNDGKPSNIIHDGKMNSSSTDEGDKPQLSENKIQSSHNKWTGNPYKADLEVVKSAINNTFETYYKYGRSNLSKAYSSYKLVKGLGLNVLKGYSLAVKGLGYYYDCTSLFYSYHKTSLITTALAYLAYYTAENYYNNTQSQLNQKKETELELIRCALTSIKIRTYNDEITYAVTNNAISNIEAQIGELIPNLTVAVAKNGDYITGNIDNSTVRTLCLDFDYVIAHDIILTSALDKHTVDSILTQQKILLMVVDNFATIVPHTSTEPYLLSMNDSNHIQYISGSPNHIYNTRYPNKYTPSRTYISNIFEKGYIDERLGILTGSMTNYNVTYVPLNNNKLMMCFTPTTKINDKFSNRTSNTTLYEHEGNYIHAQLTVTKTQAGNSAILYYGLPGSNKVYSTTIDIACIMVEGKNKNPHSNIVSQGLLASKHGEPHLRSS